MASPSQSRNYSILAVPATYFLAFPPYIYQFAQGMISSGYTATNVLPRTNLDLLKGKIPQATWSSLIIGNYAKLPVSDLNFAAAEYIGARIVYTALYMTTKNEAWSYLRTGAYAWSLAAPMWILWKAGKKIRDLGPEKKDL